MNIANYLLKNAKKLSTIAASTDIHCHPVKHGYVNDPHDWPWSSLSIYYEDKGKDWLQDQWKVYKPPFDLGKGWDDHVLND
jgi:hypothetical protein